MPCADRCIEGIYIIKVQLLSNLLHRRRGKQPVHWQSAALHLVANASRPFSKCSSRRSLANHCRTLAVARRETSNSSQSSEGPALASLEVKISTLSPDFSSDSNATSLPLTFAPIQRCPTSVCTAYVMSTGGEP